MSFSSYSFVFLFLPLTVAIYWALSRFRKQVAVTGWLLLTSIVFYACGSWRSLLIILPSVLLDFAIAKIFLSLMASRVRERAAVIGIGVAANVLFLAYFKYGQFLSDPISSILGHSQILTTQFLPLGISFLTFQKIAFLCDIYAGQVQEINFGEYLLFALFFPRTIAGPIVHYREIMPQFKEVRSEQAALNISVGFCLFSIGLFKKCVIADGVASYVGRAFDLGAGADPVPFFEAWTGILAYTLQLYFDFSGYSDMALGTARMLGIRLPMNFNSPLKASSVVEFWGRWHITLTRFLTWYVYIPLVRRTTRKRAAQGKSLLRGPKSTPGAVASLIAVPTGVTMLISGVWHGVGWQFIVWGLLHGVYLTINQAWRLWRTKFWIDQKSYDRVMRPLGTILTLGSVVLGLVLFRADSVSNALSILAGMMGLHGVVPRGAQVLSHAGYSFDWTLMWQPWGPFVWILPLFAVVLFCPNSLELMRRFEPALGFPAVAPRTEPNAVGAEPVKALSNGSAVKAFPSFLRAWSIARNLARIGLTFSQFTAVAMGLLFALGTMAIDHSMPFLYGVF